LFAIANLPWQLDDYDQAKQAFTSFEMSRKAIGSISTRARNESRQSRRCRLVSAALFAMTRSWEIAWRLPSLSLRSRSRSCYSALLKTRMEKSPRYCGQRFGHESAEPGLATLVRTTCRWHL